MQRGRVKLPPELRRSEQLRLLVTPGELADIKAIADDWGVPPSTATWAMLSTFLAKARGRANDIGSLGVTFQATLDLIASQKPIKNRTHDSVTPEDGG